ncbi:MAG TPA: pitrilysin family protein [Gammaproteobacteria bacterium]|nr:pitrilysin family protein [Gammaproteobacteria bacterium]
MSRLFRVILLIILPTLASANDVAFYQLPNGLQLFVQEDHRAPVAVTQVWYKVGSGYEPNGITGISHALEHMMFKGTPKYGPGKFAEIIAANGGQMNAFTANDFTAYYEIMAKDKLPLSFELEADRMRNLSLDPAQFAKEIQVVMEERRMRVDDDPQMKLYELFMAQAHVASPYHHLTIGWMNDLQHLTVDDVRRWYQNWYAPNNAILVVVGDVNPEAVHQLALKYFGSLPASQLPVVKPEAEIPTPGERNLVVKFPAELPLLAIGYNVPVIKTQGQSNDAYVLAVIAAILDGGSSTRLNKDLVRGQQIAAQANASYSPYSRLSDLLILSGTPAPGHTIAELKTALFNEIKKLQTSKVATDELERVKAGVIANKVFSQDSIESQAEDIGSLEAVGLPWKLKEDFIQHISAVTPNDVQAVASRYLVPENMTVAELQPLPLPKNQPSPPPPMIEGAKYVH